jgi:hypothetical protein
LSTARAPRGHGRSYGMLADSRGGDVSGPVSAAAESARASASRFPAETDPARRPAVDIALKAGLAQWQCSGFVMRCHPFRTIPRRPVGSRESITSEGQASRLMPALATAWCQFGWQFGWQKRVQAYRGFESRHPPLRVGGTRAGAGVGAASRHLSHDDYGLEYSIPKCSPTIDSSASLALAKVPAAPISSRASSSRSSP